jgi:hypothetical protein
LQNPSKTNGDNLSNVRPESSRNFRNKKKKEYPKENVNGLEPISKNKNSRVLHRGINEFNKGYQRRSKIVKDEKNDLLADFYSIVNRSKNYFSQLSNIHDVNEVRGTEIYSADPRVREPILFEV